MVTAGTMQGRVVKEAAEALAALVTGKEGQDQLGRGRLWNGESEMVDEKGSGRGSKRNSAFFPVSGSLSFLAISEDMIRSCSFSP
jgi:hypothetical protein